MRRVLPKEWNLTQEQVREIYEVEKRLADKLRSASKLERIKLYPEVYDEYYRLLPFHPHHVSPEPTADWLEWQMLMMKGLLHESTVFLEIGSGDGSLSREVAKRVGKVYSLDVSGEFTSEETLDNLETIASTGIEIPLPENSLDVVFSNQLMEHLHPEDAIEQLQNIVRALKPGGAYICTTPNRISGPHDISRFFDATPTGFHLKEYSNSELRNAFLRAGFTKAPVYSIIAGKYRAIPIMVIKAGEILCALLPGSLLQNLLKYRIVQLFLHGTIIGIK